MTKSVPGTKYAVSDLVAHLKTAESADKYADSISIDGTIPDLTLNLTEADLEQRLQATGPINTDLAQQVEELNTEFLKISNEYHSILSSDKSPYTAAELTTYSSELSAKSQLETLQETLETVKNKRAALITLRKKLSAIEQKLIDIAKQDADIHAKIKTIYDENLAKLVLLLEDKLFANARATLSDLEPTENETNKKLIQMIRTDINQEHLGLERLAQRFLNNKAKYIAVAPNLDHIKKKLSEVSDKREELMEQVRSLSSLMEERQPIVDASRRFREASQLFNKVGGNDKFLKKLAEYTQSIALPERLKTFVHHFNIEALRDIVKALAKAESEKTSNVLDTKEVDAKQIVTSCYERYMRLIKIAHEAHKYDVYLHDIQKESEKRAGVSDHEIDRSIDSKINKINVNIDDLNPDIKKETRISVIQKMAYNRVVINNIAANGGMLVNEAIHSSQTLRLIGKYAKRDDVAQVLDYRRANDYKDENGINVRKLFFAIATAGLYALTNLACRLFSSNGSKFRTDVVKLAAGLKHDLPPPPKPQRTF